MPWVLLRQPASLREPLIGLGFDGLVLQSATMNLDVRDFHPSDLPDLYRICLLTGHQGGDASPLYRDPLLLGHFYAAPYPLHEPDLCLIATLDGVPSGYILGCSSSAAFRDWSEEHWFPALRRRHPLRPETDQSPDAVIIQRIHEGSWLNPDTEAYPAHLHIDLLPSLQSRGVGRRLLNLFFDRLRAKGCPAVHLGVSAANTGGIAFYEKTGFHLIKAYSDWSAYGLRL